MQRYDQSGFDSSMIYDDEGEYVEYDEAAARIAELEATLAEAAAAAGVPLTTYDIDDADIAALYRSPLVLVRPDGHVCWRGTDDDGDARTVIDTVRGAAPGARAT